MAIEHFASILLITVALLASGIATYFVLSFFLENDINESVRRRVTMGARR